MADITVDIPPLYSSEDTASAAVVVEFNGVKPVGNGGSAYIEQVLINETLSDYTLTDFNTLTDMGNWEKKVWFKNGWFGNHWMIKMSEFEKLNMLTVNREPRPTRG